MQEVQSWGVEKEQTPSVASLVNSCNITGISIVNIISETENASVYTFWINATNEGIENKPDIHENVICAF